MWNSALALFESYMGTGLIITFFLVMAVYLFFAEKDPAKRILFVYMPAVLLLLYFNPLVCRVIYTVIGDEVYYRILWLIPVTMVLAYGMVLLYQRINKNYKTLFLIFSAVMVMCSGSLIYRNVNFRKADNWYHIPQTVVEICDAIEVEGREVMAVFPIEMLQYVRQYSPYVCMPYGREVTIDRWGRYTELQQVMIAETLIVEDMAPLAKEKNCHYVIVDSEKEILGNMQDYGYELFDSIGGYDIYVDKTIYIGL